MKKVIVTGSSGFVGKRLIQELKKNKVKVVEFDHASGQDVLHLDQLKKASKDCDTFFHLAAILDEDQSIEKLRLVNVQGTKNAFEAAREKGCQTFVLLSSVGVYGSFDGQANESFPYHSITNYEQSKMEAEQFVLSQKKEELRVVVARSALVLGPNAYWKSITKIIAKGFPIIGSGQNKWQTVYVDDLVSALVFLGKNPKASGVYNVAEEPSQSQSLNGLVELFQKELGLEKKVKHIPVWLGKGISHGATLLAALQQKKTILRPQYVDRLLKNRNYSIDKIKALGWKPKVSTRKAVEKTVKELDVQ